MLRDPPVSHPSVHPLHMAGDNFPECKSDHVTPPLNIPLLLPQGLEDNSIVKSLHDLALPISLASLRLITFL